MRPRFLTTLCLTLVVAVAPAASLAAGPRAGVTRRHSGGIKLFKSIGGVSLGMTPAQVRRVLGRPSAVNRFQGKVTSYSYFGAHEFAISFDSVRAADPADSILLNQGSYRTPQGIHVGSTKRQLKRAYRNVSCQGSVCKIYEGAPLTPGTRDTEFIVATNGRVIGIAVEIMYE
ncbi:MAG: outer membrane protein assembly factor BamE [Solirubrobacteraceae bacterium]